MPVLNNISCAIHTDDGPIQEFPCLEVNSSAPTSTVYIPVRDGQKFTINCNVLVPSQHLATCALSFRASIDGVLGRGKVCSLENSRCVISGAKVQNSGGIWELRKFLFSSINFTEDHSADALALDKINKLGEIVVSVSRYRVRKRRAQPRGWRAGDVCEEGPSVVHEKSVKGRDVSHSVGQAPSGKRLCRAKGIPIRTPKSVSGTYLDTEESPYMTFRFLYRSERALKSMGLLKDSPSSPPPPPNLQIERNTSPARVKPEIKHELRKLKRERADSGPPAVPGQSKVPKLADIEIVDLTGGD